MLKFLEKTILLKIIGLIAVVFAAAFFSPISAEAAIRTSTATGGVWNIGSTWVGGVAPANTDSVIIATTGGNSVTMGAARTNAGLTVNAGAILNFDGAYVLSENGNVVVNGSVTGATGTISMTTKNLIINGTGVIDSVILAGAQNFSFASTADLTINNNINSNGRTVTNNGTINLNGNYARIGGTAIWVQGTNAVLNISGAFTPVANVTVTATAAGNIVNYNGTSAQIIKNTTYANLKVNNSVGATLNGASTITNLTIGDITANSIFNDGGFVITPGTGSVLNLVSGTYTLGSATVGTAFPAWGTRNISSGTIIEYGSGVAQTVSSAPSYQDLTFSGAGVKTTASGILSVGGNWSTTGGTATLSTNNSSATVTGNILGTGAITLGSGTITLGGNWTNSGTFTKGTGTVTYNGSSTQTLAALNYNNLILSGVGQKNSAGNVSVGGNLTNSSVFDLDGNTLSVTGTKNNTGGTIRFSGATNGLVIPTGTIEYYGASQTITAGTYNNLTINQSSGSATLGGTITVGGVLNLSAGNVITGVNNLYINSTGSVSRTSGHIIGNLRKYIGTILTSETFEIGDASNYTPVSINFGTVTTSGDLTVNTTAGDHPNISDSLIVPTLTANRYWTLTNSGIVFNNYSVTFNFINPGDLDAGADTSTFSIGQYSSSTWSYPTVGTKTTTSTQATGVTGFGDFQLGFKKITTTTALVSSANPSIYGNSVTFTATVTPASGGAPSGTVTFKDGATTLGTGTLNGANPGVATYNTTALNIINSPHSITAVYEGDTSHTTSTSSAVSQVISQKALTVSGITAENKEYDRLTTAVINTLSAALVGVISPDSVTLNIGSATGSFVDKTVGTGKTVTISGLTISGTDSANYSLTQPITAANITAKTITATGVTAEDKDYDGNTDAVISIVGASLVGVISGDIVTLNSTSATASFDTAEVGENKLVTISGLTLSGADGINYSLTQPTATATIKNPIPTTTSISPSSAIEGDPGFIITVNGTKFLPNSVVRFAGVDRETTYVNSTQVTANILASDIATTGNYNVCVFNPVPGGGLSNSQIFTVNVFQNPIPIITSISPTSKTLGDVEFIMTVSGSNFVPSSVVKFNGSSKTTTYVSNSQLTAVIPASDLLTAGTFDITVFNTIPGGGTSNTQTFTVNNPVPTTTSISPNFKILGDPEFTVTVNGTNFLSSSVVNFNGSARTTTYVSDTQLTAIIPASDLTTATTSALITVFNIVPGGGTSNAQTFVVNAELTNPVPTTTSISPTSVTAGGSDFTLTVNGTNFIANSSVKFNGSLRATTFVSSTELTASITALDISSAGSFDVVVVNPLPGGGPSNAQTFIVVAAGDTIAPVVTAFSIPSTSSSVFVPITTFTATDNVGVTNYLITLSSSEPLVNDPNWSAVTPTTFNVSTQGVKTLYAWVKDAAGNISTSFSASVTVTFIEVPLDNIQSLVVAGTIVPVGSISSTNQIAFNQEVHVNFTGNTSIIIPFGTTMNTATNVDFSQLTGSTNVSTSDLSSDYTAVSAISFGLPSTSLTTSQPVTINIVVDTIYNDQSLDVFKKEVGGSTWNQITSCTVNSGICSFTTSSFSEFVVANPILSPATISNLTASNPTTSSATLTWTAPGNIGNVGTAMLYDMRYSTSNITSLNFASATQVSGMPAPLIAGTQQSKIVSGLSANTIYYFAIKTSNNIGFTSGISNIAQITTPSITSAVSTGVEGARVPPTKVSFTGRAYPEGKVKVYRRSLIEGVFKNEYLPNNDMVVDNNGNFTESFTGLLQANYLFALEAIDKNGISGGLSAYTVDLLSADKLIVENIFMPPTISLDSSSVTKGKDITIFGYATPGSSIEIKVDSVLDYKTTAGTDGRYKLALNTQRFGAKDHFITARQVDLQGNKSDYSSMKNFTVSSLAYPKADLNADGFVDIKDWSIFLSRWTSTSNDLKATLDISGDGKVDITDLSIFLKAIKGE